MAIGMKHWIGLVGAGFLAVALWTLPPDALPLHQRRISPEEVHYQALLREARSVHAQVQRMRWSDSLSALTLGTSEDGLALGLPEAAASLTPEGIREWAELLAAHEDALEPRAEDVLLGLFVQPVRHAALPDVQRPSMRPRREAYVGVRDGTAYCFEVEKRDPDRYPLEDADLRRMGREGFRACRFYGKYGIPGPGIEAWLEAGGMRFALRDAGARPTDEDYARFNRRRSAEWWLSAELFGLNLSPVSTEFFEVDRCLAGRPAGCVEAITDRRIVGLGGDATEAADLPVVTYVERGRLEPPFPYENDYLLGDLEAEFGPEAFSRFWRSEAALEEAFRSAFGLEMGDWLVSWAETHIGTYDAGPGLRAGAFWLSVLTLTLMAGAASGTALFRRVG